MEKEITPEFLMKPLLIILLFLIALPVQAILTDYVPHPKPADFWRNSEGETFGILEDRSKFSQTNVATDLGIRLQKFQWREGFWYISDKGAIEADYDLQAFSIYLSL